MVIAKVVLFSLVLVFSFVEASEQISIKRAYIQFGGKMTNTILVVEIQPDDGNRLINVRCSSEDANSEVSSQRELNGLKGHVRQNIFEFNLPEGQYECRATLARSNGDEFSDRISFFIR